MWQLNSTFYIPILLCLMILWVFGFDDDNQLAVRRMELKKIIISDADLTDICLSSTHLGLPSNPFDVTDVS